MDDQYSTDKTRAEWLPATSCCADRIPQKAQWQTLPSWLTEADVDFYAGEFARSGSMDSGSWSNREIEAKPGESGWKVLITTRRRAR